MNSKFVRIWSSHLPYRSQVDLYENLYLKAIIDSYYHIDKRKGKEEKIRDRFYYDLTHRNPLTKKWCDLELLDIRFEKWKMDTDKNKSRVDLSFFWSGFSYFEIECKLLFQQPSKNEAYFNDGLIRFINLKYAEKNEYAGMLGFVVSGDIETIRDKILSRTKTFYPSASPIQSNFINWKYIFISHHLKKDKRNIRIYHLFFQFTEKDN
ncbi:MAG: hypothetical protein IH852_11345 [Bacteroidetes bacterium]|nr:hypothetical protein [Bacteroidota bacterium]